MTKTIFIASFGFLTLVVLSRIVPVDRTFTADWTPKRNASFYQVQVLTGRKAIAEYVRVSDSLTATVTTSRNAKLEGRMRTCYSDKCTGWTKPVL